MEIKDLSQLGDAFDAILQGMQTQAEDITAIKQSLVQATPPAEGEPKPDGEPAPDDDPKLDEEPDKEPTEDEQNDVEKLLGL